MSLPGRGMGIRGRLLFAFAAVAVVGILAMALNARFLMERQFQDLVAQRIQEQIGQTRQTLEEMLAEHGSWNHDSLSIIGMHSLQQGFVIRLENLEGTVLWDARTHNNGLCQATLDALARSMSSRYPDWKPDYREEKVALQQGGMTMGWLIAGYYGPYFYTGTDLFYLQNVSTLVLFSGIASLVLALLLGLLMSRLISRPLKLITLAAHRLGEGDLESQVDPLTHTGELVDLAGSLNSLASRLKEQSFLRRRLGSDISHELRTPLASLQGSLEAMIDGLWPMDVQRLESCREEVLRLSRLVGQLEILEKIEEPRGSRNLETVDCDLGDLVTRVCTNAEGGFLAAGLSFAWNQVSVKSRTDPDTFSQILVNLLSNAAKYTPSGGRVELEMLVGGEAGTGSGDTGRARASGAGDSTRPGMPREADSAGRLVIRVSDTGPGIPESDLTRIFERFYRVDTSRTRETGGAGIGLSIALAKARLLGGDLSAANREGGGAVFTLRLPLHGD